MGLGLQQLSEVLKTFWHAFPVFLNLVTFNHFAIPNFSGLDMPILLIDLSQLLPDCDRFCLISSFFIQFRGLLIGFIGGHPTFGFLANHAQLMPNEGFWFLIFELFKEVQGITIVVFSFLRLILQHGDFAQLRLYRRLMKAVADVFHYR